MRVYRPARSVLQIHAAIQAERSAIDDAGSESGTGCASAVFQMRLMARLELRRSVAYTSLLMLLRERRGACCGAMPSASSSAQGAAGVSCAAGRVGPKRASAFKWNNGRGSSDGRLLPTSHLQHP